MEIRVIKPFMAFGRRVEVGDVIDLPVADAAYAVSLGRAEAIETAEQNVMPVKKPASAKKAKAE